MPQLSTFHSQLSASPAALPHNPALSLWLSVDPLSDKYPGVSPYVYCADNPVRLVDVDGREISPIFSTSGELLGTDSKGWKGTPIVMGKKDFRNGMSHEEALKKGTELDEYGKGIKISDADWKKVEANGGERMTPSVENRSSHTIYYKPEEGSNAHSIGAGKDLYAPVDGIAAPHIHKRMVYKITNGVRVAVTNNEINITKTSGCINKIVMTLRGGWKDESWHSALTTDRFLMSNSNDQPPYYMYKTPDHGWDDLFSKSR